MNTRSRAVAVIGSLSLLFVALLLVAVPSYAQEAVGTIFGRVVDSSGAVVAGAQVSVRNVATGVSTTYLTTKTGDYSAVNLNPGTYSVTVNMMGFKVATSNGLIVEVDKTLRQDFALQIGEASQTVTVTTDSQMLQAGNATVGQVVTEKQIAALPLSGRDFTNLITLSAGVSTPIGGIQKTVFNPTGLNDQFTMTSIDGARPASLSYIVDGFTDTDFFFSKPTNLPPADAVQEFKLQNGLYSSQYGFGSAQVNVAIKTGTNMLHGTGYDFVQNAAFQRRSPLAAFLAQLNKKPIPTKPPHLVQNEFGGNLGGPFVIPKIYNGRNRTFWFFSYDGGRKRTTSGLNSLQVPTAAERKGDFSDWPYPIYNPATTGSVAPTPDNPTGRLPYANNQIPSSAFNAIGQKVLAYYPAPNITCQMPCSNLAGLLPVKTDTNVYTGRFDHHINERNQLWFTANHGNIDAPGVSMLPESASGVTNSSNLYGGHYLHAFSNNLLGDVRIGYSNLKFHEGANSAFGPNLSANLGLQNVPNIPAYYSLPIVTVGDGYSTLGQGNNGYSQWDDIYEYGGDITYVHGAHKLNMGADWRHLQIRDQDGFTVNGHLIFNGAYTASNPTGKTIGTTGSANGNGLADLLMGNPISVPQTPAPLGSDDFNLSGNQYAFYFQDDYHASSRVTLNLGLRYEHPALFHSIDNSGAILNLNTPGGGVMYADRSFVDGINAPTNIKNTYFQCCAPNSLIDGEGIKLFPRLGFAWSPFDSSRVVVRGGYGVYSDIYMRFYDGTDYDNNQLLTLTANPNYPSANGTEKASPLALNTLWLPPIKLDPSADFPLPWQYSISTPWPLNKHPYTQQWGLGVQYALTPDMLLDVGYVGSRSLHQPTQTFFNQATLPTTPDALSNGTVCNALRDASQAVGSAAGCLKTGSAFQPIDTRVPFKNLSVHSYADANILSSAYNSLQVRLNRRFSHGLTFLGSYTYSKALDESSEIATFSNGSGGSNIITDARRTGLDWGPADFDQTHRFVVSYLWAIPVGKGQRYSLGPANWVLGNWQTSGVVTLASGLPFSVFCCTRGANNDLSGNPFSDRLRANSNGSHNPNFHQSLQHWFDTTPYSVPDRGTLGNVGRNTLRAPGQRLANVSFIKEFPLTERQRFEFRVDVFNFLSSYHTGSLVPVHKVGPPSTFFGGIIVDSGPFLPLGKQILYNPRQIQMALRYSF